MIGIVCPTKGRPKGFARMSSSLARNCVTNIVRVAAVEDSVDGYDLSGWEHIVTVNGSSCLAFEYGVRYLLQNRPDVDIVVPLNDDAEIYTPGWDKIVAEAMPANGLAILYPMDGYQNKATFPILSRRWIRTLGYYAPPGFLSWYPDTWHANIAARLRVLTPLYNVRFEHFHPFAGKSATDKTYAEGSMNKLRIKHDTKLWQETALQRAMDADKIRKALAEDERADHNGGTV